MNLSDYLEQASQDDIRIKGTRIGIETVLYEHLHQSQSPEAIAARYPSLTLEQVYAAITYYLHHESAMRGYLDRWLQRAAFDREQQDRNPSDAIKRLRQLKAEAAAR